MRLPMLTFITFEKGMGKTFSVLTNDSDTGGGGLSTELTKNFRLMKRCKSYSNFWEISGFVIDVI